MLLKDSFYTLQTLEKSEGQLDATIILDANHAIFEGHFPNNPVTPGVVQLEIIKELLAVHFNEKVRLKAISNCKYLAILNPKENAQISVKIGFSELENELKVSAQFYTEATVFTKVQGIYYL